jgi:hypothetical protein
MNFFKIINFIFRITIVDALNFRPNWWYFEKISPYDKFSLMFYQASSSCEPTGGNPSRHMSLSTAFLYTLLHEFLGKTNCNKNRCVIHGQINLQK